MEIWPISENAEIRLAYWTLELHGLFRREILRDHGHAISFFKYSRQLFVLGILAPSKFLAQHHQDDRENRDSHRNEQYSRVQRVIR